MRRQGPRKRLGRFLASVNKTALPSDAVVGEHRVQKVEPCRSGSSSIKVKGPVLGPDARPAQKADAGACSKKDAPDAVFPDRPVPGRCTGPSAARRSRCWQTGRAADADRSCGVSVPSGCHSRCLPMNQSQSGWAASAPRSVRQQAGGHGVVTVEKQQPVACGGLKAGVARRWQGRRFPGECTCRPGSSAARASHICAALVSVEPSSTRMHSQSRGPGCSDHAFDAGGQVVLHVVDGDDDGKERHKCLLAIKPSPEGGGGPKGRMRGECALQAVSG